MDKFEDIAFDLSPVDKKNFVTQRQAVAICKEQGIPTSLRTIQLYLEKGILRKGYREGKEVYYSKGYLIHELGAIHFLKTTFKLSINEIKELAQYKKAHLYRLVEHLREILMFVFDNDRDPKKSGRLFIEIMNNRIYQAVADAYFKRVLSGQDYIVEDIKKFIELAVSKK